MFGWLAHALAAARATAPVSESSITRCSVAMHGDELAACLPLLGSVLCLPAQRAIGDECATSAGWLVARRELAPLLHTRELLVSSMIGADGPREWIDARDANGAPCARLYLLPDTDYLAWDALLARARHLPAAPLSAQRLGYQVTQAELVYFHVRRLGALHLLDSTRAGAVSRLGRGIAHDVARAASVALAGS